MTTAVPAAVPAAGAGSGPESHATAAESSWPTLSANRYFRSARGTIRTVYGPVAVYPVGVLAAIRLYWRARRLGSPVANGVNFRPLRSEWRYIKYQLKRREWRAVKNSFNGWLAEPEWSSGEGPDWRRCGKGWTPERALRRLERNIWETNA